MIASMLSGCSKERALLRIMLDSGHTIKDPGALGIKGRYEKHYNDALVSELKELLQKEEGVIVYTTALGVDDLALHERVDRANEFDVDLFISIHHNSVSERRIVRLSVDGVPVAKSNIPVAGYAIYVSQENRRLKKSILFSTVLGRSMEQIGRSPFSAERSAELKTTQRLMNERFGIYQFDKLAVLRGTIMPAVLFEVGFIVDSQDEQFVSSKRKEIAKQIVMAINRYRDHDFFLR